MLIMSIVAVLAAAAAGLAVKLFLDNSRSGKEITWNEFAASMVAITIVIVPLTVYSGRRIAKANNLSFNQYLNGWETNAKAIPIQCSRDGPCRYEYDCDPYVVMVPESCNCDKDGCSTCYRAETRYHSCPYVTVETTYEVETTIGDFTIAEHRFPENPQSCRWREGVEVPDYVIGNAGVGAPPFWLQAKARVDSGNPGPVTKRASYDNYILASDRTILQQYSANIEAYNNLGLLPRLESGVYDFYAANKAYFVGFQTSDAARWQKSLEYLNAGLGTEMEGDLHLVIVKDARISENPDAYIFALKAYWQNPKVFNKDAIGKNSIILVVGTEDGKTVSWARAMTGMPLGNEALATAIRNSLKGTDLTPEAFFGKVRGKFKRVKGSDQLFHASAEAQDNTGAVSRILWGLTDKSSKFQRVSMGGKGEKGKGFKYLDNEIELTRGQEIMIAFAAFFFSMVAWIVSVVSGDRWGRWGRY